MTRTLSAAGMATLLAAGALAQGLTASRATPAETRLEAWAEHRRLHERSPFRDLPARALGPKMAGALVEAIAVAPDDPSTIYVGIGSGNLWKTDNNGITWSPIFEHESTFAIGDVAVAPSDSRIVWVGTGETQPRHSGYAYAGTGVFKSIDAGRTWQHMGLAETHHIGKVVIHPRNPDVVYVAALGHFRSTNEERGVFRTTDGGRTWEKVLFVSERTGVVDLVMDPSDPRVLYAAAWELIAGPESGIYKTTDGGRRWAKLAGGLPGGALGRMGLDVAPGDPNVVYAFIDNHAPYASEEQRDRRIVGGEVYRSDDKGRTWRRANTGDLYPVFTIFGWKFCDVRVSPDNADEIYILGLRGFRSTDGGRTYEPFGETILRLHDTEGKVLHLDHHEIWIDPRNPDRVLLGNDGGFFVSHDRARTWLHVNNIPAPEFYAISVDMKTPYTIYGGTQDNAALYGPSDVALADGAADPWRHVYLDRWTGGDSFDTLVDPTDDRIVYYEHQHGAMRRMDLSGPSVQTGGPGTTDIRPRAPQGTPPYRFGWHTPFLISRHNPLTLYAGANVVLKSLDRGDRWRPISPDLSDPGGGERAVVPFGTISTLAESPRAPGLLYAGTEGGTIWLTRDDGATWTKIGTGLPRKWVSRVIASQHQDGSVYVAFTGYREDDFEAYLFASDDFGGTWRSISRGIPSESINVVREDPRNPEILYAGTDLGVYVSLDRGASWLALCAGLPSTPVHDLVVHPRDDELVVGTHGRGVFVLDARPVQGWRASDAAALTLFEPRLVLAKDRDDVEPARARGEAAFPFRLRTAGPVTVTILDAARGAVRRWQVDAVAGLNVVRWDLRVERPAEGTRPARIEDAPYAAYRIELTAGSAGAEAGFEVRRDPRRF